MIKQEFFHFCCKIRNEKDLKEGGEEKFIENDF